MRRRETEETKVDRPQRGVEIATPTAKDPVPAFAEGTPDPGDRGEPIRVISMKDAMGQRPAVGMRAPKHHEIKLRSLSEISGANNKLATGHLAPPRDWREVRARRVRDRVIWTCVAIMIACAVAIAVWFIARR